MLSHMPKPLGIEMAMRACVDSDHATDPIARKSRTSFLAHLQNAPIDWTSKQQAGVKPSTSGSKFTATKQCIASHTFARGRRYNVRMMGTPCGLPMSVYGDNKSALCNMTFPGSTRLSLRM